MEAVKLDKLVYPALWQVLYGNPSHPCSCSECPLSTRDPGPNRLFRDPDQSYFRCAMPDLFRKGLEETHDTDLRSREARKAKRVWGERPDCLSIDWKDLARLDLERILLAWSSSMKQEAPHGA